MVFGRGCRPDKEAELPPKHPRLTPRAPKGATLFRENGAACGGQRVLATSDEQTVEEYQRSERSNRSLKGCPMAHKARPTFFVEALEEADETRRTDEG